MRFVSVFGALAALMLQGCSTIESVTSKMFGPSPESESTSEDAAATPPGEDVEGKPRADKGYRLYSLPNFKPENAEVQGRDDWCWAACVVMIFDYKELRRKDGSRVTQEEIVQYFKHGEKNQAGNQWEITRALGADTADDWFKEKKNQTLDFSGSSQFDSLLGYTRIDKDLLIDDLLKEDPSVVCFSNWAESRHACVVTAAEYRKVSDGKGLTWKELEGVTGDVPDIFKGTETEKMAAPAKYEIRSVTVFDPYTGKQRKLTGDEFNTHADFVMGRRKAAAVLLKAMSISKSARK